MTTPDMPQHQPDQPFSFGLEIHGLGPDPEAARRLFNQEFGALAMRLAKEHGFMVTGLNLAHGSVAPEAQAPVADTAPADPTPEPGGNATPEVAKEVSFFDPETQASLDITIEGNFLTQEEVDETNGVTGGDEPDRNVYQTVAEKIQNDDLVVVNEERQKQFTDALAMSGVRTVRDALILGMGHVRDEVNHLSSPLKRRIFKREVESLVQSIVDTIPENVYNEFTTPEVSPGKKDDDIKPITGKVLLDMPLSLEQIARICNHPSQVPALAVKTAAVQNFGHFPEAWNGCTLAELIDPGVHAELVRGATAELTAQQAQRCLDVAKQFASQLAQLTANASK